MNTCVSVGDRVQIEIGSIDVINGHIAKRYGMYVHGTQLFAIVYEIVENWITRRRFNLPHSITRCTLVHPNTDQIVWSVRIEDIAPNIIRSSQPETIQREPFSRPKPLTPTTQGEEVLGVNGKLALPTVEIIPWKVPYVTLSGAQSWLGDEAAPTVPTEKEEFIKPLQIRTVTGSPNPFRR